MQENIDEILEFLSWQQSDDIQKHGIELASKITHLSVLIMPIEDKSVWENCAKILISKSNDELQHYLIKLFEWLQDLNWPGAYLVYDRMISIPTKNLLYAYQYSLLKAKQTKDKSWEKVLVDFWKEKQLLDNVND